MRRRLSMREGFTLIELLTVMAIIAVLTAIAAPTLAGASGDMSLIDGGNRVMADLNLARQEAMSNNQTVQVRFYKDSNNNNLYDSVAHVISSPTGGSPQWPDRPIFLPQGTAFYTAGTDTYSPLINAATGASVPQSFSNDTDASTPQQLKGQTYVAFDFRADGSTDINQGTLDPSNNVIASWCVTLYPTNKGIANGTPVNYVTILVDPTTGAVKTYQPK